MPSSLKCEKWAGLQARHKKNLAFAPERVLSQVLSCMSVSTVCIYRQLVSFTEANRLENGVCPVLLT